MLSEASCVPKDRHWWVRLYKGLGVIRFTETESRMGARAREGEELVVNGDRVQFWEMKIFWRWLW